MQQQAQREAAEGENLMSQLLHNAQAHAPASAPAHAAPAPPASTDPDPSREAAHAAQAAAAAATLQRAAFYNQWQRYMDTPVAVLQRGSQPYQKSTWEMPYSLHRMKRPDTGPGRLPATPVTRMCLVLLVFEPLIV